MENKETKLEEFLIVQSIVEKESKAGRKYFSVKTDQGDYSCFEFVIIKVLKENIGKKIEFETSYNKKDNGQVFKNIRRIIQIVGNENVSSKPSSNNPNNFEQITEARSMKDTSIYTSYAKDIFLEMLSMDKEEGIPAKELMQAAVDLVKQARDSFK